MRKPSATAAEIKERLHFHLRSNHIACDEVQGFNNAAMVAVNRDGSTFEYEIKISLSDLRVELKAIAEAQAFVGATVLSGLSAKARKHWAYLFGYQILYNDRWRVARIRRPNYFYFCMPEELYLKEKERIDALPYGVKDSETMGVVKRAKKLNHGGDAPCWLIAHSLMWKRRFSRE